MERISKDKKLILIKSNHLLYKIELPDLKNIYPNKYIQKIYEPD